MLRVLGIPVLSYETVLTESDLELIDNTGGDFAFGLQPSEDVDYDEDDYELSPDDPVCFGFGGLQ